MKIALVTSEFVHTKDGGLANYTYRLAKYLIEFGHDVKVIVSDSIDRVSNYDDIELHQVQIDYSKIYQKKWFGLVPSKSSNYKLFDARSKQLNSYLSQFELDMVQYAHLGGLGKYRLPNVSCVIRISSSTRSCFEMGGYGESKEEMEQQERIEFEAFKSVDSVFGPSKMMAAITQSATGVPVTVIETPYQNKESNLDTSVFENIGTNNYVLFFGSLVRLKGVETIASILEPLLSENPDLHYVFVGKSILRPNGEEMADYIRSAAGENADRVHLIGKLGQEKLKPIIANAKVVTLPSLIDNFPNTCIESMAFGKLVIGTRSNGFEQLIDSGENGYLIDAACSDQLLGAISKVLKLSEDEIQKMGKKSKDRIEQLKPSIAVKELVEYYKEVIKNK